MKFSKRKISIIVSTFFTILLVLFGLSCWLNLLVIEPTIELNIRMDAERFARNDMKLGKYKYYVLQENPSDRELLGESTQPIDHIPEIPLDIYIYYYQSSLLDNLFLINSKKMAIWYIDSYNNEIIKQFPNIDLHENDKLLYLK